MKLVKCWCGTSREKFSDCPTCGRSGATDDIDLPPDFTLDPVGEERNGEVKPVDQISYPDED